MSWLNMLAWSCRNPTSSFQQKCRPNRGYCFATFTCHHHSHSRLQIKQQGQHNRSSSRNDTTYTGDGRGGGVCVFVFFFFVLLRFLFGAPTMARSRKTLYRSNNSHGWQTLIPGPTSQKPGIRIPRNPPCMHPEALAVLLQVH